MPREHKSRREVLDAIQTIPSMNDLLATHEGHFDYELDLEVIVYGRNYNGKKVGPYVRLLTYEPGETIVHEGDWGGNTFYVVVRGDCEVVVDNGGGNKVAELKPGTQFGEMSVLAGVPRNATVKAPAQGAQILEVQRPALRLLRKIPQFSEGLDRTYRAHGRNAIVAALRAQLNLTAEQATALAALSQFRVFSKQHVLFREGTLIDRLYIIKSGWLRRGRRQADGREAEDFLGDGYCFGLEGLASDAAWPYTATLMGRTEALEISITKLRREPALLQAVAQGFGKYAPPELGGAIAAAPEVREQIVAAQERLIDTGLVDANNLLVMDMELCVRCGNCSLACHKVHGQSRLVRRGIAVTRLEKPKKSAVQHALSPAVCMHCQDPECLTGCPTGAIGRYSLGQIDIDARTCIGCGDCASQCPYNAISLIPRRREEAPKNGGLGARLRDLFRIRLDPLPAPVEQTDDLLAVKCNLCQGTSMNPEGAARPAYSCEENCPTGALARVNPKTYFGEIDRIEGPPLMEHARPAGRNIHRSDPPRLLIHILGWALVAVLTAATVGGLATYGLGRPVLGFLNMRWITGLVGLAGIALVMTYPVRRQVYRRRAGPLRYWMLAHCYLGVIAGIMLLLHGGTDAGGWLTTALMVSFDLVILTGLFGILVYAVAPRLLTKIEGEPLLLDDLKARRAELQQEIADIAASSPALQEAVTRRVVPRFVSFGYLMRQYLKKEPLDELLAAARLASQDIYATASGDRERARLERAVEAAATLRRVDALIYLHRLLKAWLPPHVVFTSLMLALMIVHIIQVIYFAAW